MKTNAKPIRDMSTDAIRAEMFMINLKHGNQLGWHHPASPAFRPAFTRWLSLRDELWMRGKSFEIPEANDNPGY